MCVQRSGAGRQPTVARSLIDCGLAAWPPFFAVFAFFFHFFFLAHKDGPSILGEWVYSTPFF
jgi:hypothetical protein